MVIVLIRWYIKRDDTSVKGFLEYWKKLTVQDPSGLVGEFLSRPMQPDEVSFEVEANSPTAAVPTHVNVGIWESVEAFQKAIGPYFGVKEPFEERARTRIVLEPKEWRIGKAKLPEEGTC